MMSGDDEYLRARVVGEHRGVSTGGDDAAAERRRTRSDDPWTHSCEWPCGKVSIGEQGGRSLTRAVLAATEAQRRQAAAVAVRHAMRAVGLEHHPGVVDTLDNLDALTVIRYDVPQDPDEPPLVAPETEDMSHQAMAEPLGPVASAFWALRHACSDNSVFAALDSVWRAAFTFHLLAREGSDVPVEWTAVSPPSDAVSADLNQRRVDELLAGVHAVLNA